MANARLSDAIADFMRYAESAYAKGSIRSLRWTLDVLLTEVGNIWVKNLTDRHVDTMLALAASKGASAGTINNHVSRLRTFCEFCRRRKFAPASFDPVGHRRRVRSVPGRPFRLPVERFPELLDAADGPRDRVAFALGLYLLVRQSELVALRVGHVNLTSGEVDVSIQKTSQRDVMPISSELDIELRDWLGIYAEAMRAPLRPEWLLVPSKPGGWSNQRDATGKIVPYSGPLRLVPDRPPTRLDLALKKALRRMGYGADDLGGVGLHTLRRSGARARFDALREQGYDGALRQVQALLHHSSAANTERYLGIDLDVQHRNEALRGKSMYGATPKAAPPRLRVVKGGA